MFAVGHGARDVEPVDARLRAHVERAGRNHRTALMLHLPAILHKRTQRAQQHLRR